jgi:mono/diheme cytochrome c family protein
MRTRKTGSLSTVVISAVALTTLGGPLMARAQDPARAAYLRYCSACHGETGKGDGVVSGFLRPKPTDLTQVAKQAGGSFPFMQVIESIDGTKTVRAHGDSDMPVWAEVFRMEGSAPIAQQAETRGKALLITEYVSRIQAK